MASQFSLSQPIHMPDRLDSSTVNIDSNILGASKIMYL